MVDVTVTDEDGIDAADSLKQGADSIAGTAGGVLVPAIQEEAVVVHLEQTAHGTAHLLADERSQLDPLHRHHQSLQAEANESPPESRGTLDTAWTTLTLG